MADRGVLPRFRPASLQGREGAARPAIRPLRATPPPPPPSPPRRVPSGIRTPNPAAVEGNPYDAARAATERPTGAAGRRLVHELARELPREHRFDAETQARRADQGVIAASRWSPSRRGAMDVPYEALPSLEAKQPDVYPSKYDS